MEPATVSNLALISVVAALLWAGVIMLHQQGCTARLRRLERELEKAHSRAASVAQAALNILWMLDNTHRYDSDTIAQIRGTVLQAYGGDINVGGDVLGQDKLSQSLTQGGG